MIEAEIPLARRQRKQVASYMHRMQEAELRADRAEQAERAVAADRDRWRRRCEEVEAELASTGSHVARDVRPCARTRGKPDPVFAAIEMHRAESVACRAAWDAVPDHHGSGPISDEIDVAQDRAAEQVDRAYEVLLALFAIRPTTIAGFKAQAEYIIEDAELDTMTETTPQMRAIIASALSLMGETA